MPSQTATKPVEDTVAKINNELAVGGNLEFQRKWWKFERSAWIVLTMIIIADVLGCFGRGPLAKAEMGTSDGAAKIQYERIERYGTPSVLIIHFGESAVQNGKIQLWVSDSLIGQLGNQRISPQPETSVLTDDGILYTFSATKHADSVQFALQPGKPGIFHIAFRVVGHQTLEPTVYVMP